MIRELQEQELKVIYEIINDSAISYKGIIPADRWREPYITWEELYRQIKEGIHFWCYEEEGTILGVMGVQQKKEVTLIRHSYVQSLSKTTGVGGKLLAHLCQIAATSILISTWADAVWAIKFYQSHGFRLLIGAEKDTLLKKYWNIPEHQIDTLVVLINEV